MRQRFLASNNFYISSFIYFASSAFASIVNYLLYPVLSRILTPAELGDVGVVSAILLQAGSILLAFNIISIYVVSREPEKVAVKKLEAVQTRLIHISIVVSLLLVACLPIIKHILNIGSYSTLVILGFLLIVVIPTVTWTGYLQGHKQLPLVGFYNVVNSVTKVLAAVVFASLGFGAGGAALGMLSGFFCGLIVLYVVSPFPLPSLMSSFKKSRVNTPIHELRPLIIKSLIVSVLLALLYSLEFLSAKYFFNAHDAGFYIGSLTLASSAYYLIATLMWVVLPHYSPTNENHNQKLVIKALLLSGSAIVFLSTLFYLFGEQLSTFALGHDYRIIAPIIWKNTVSQGLIAIITLLLFSQLVRGKYRATTRTILTVLPVFLGVIVVAPSTYQELANTMIGGEVAGIILFVISGFLLKTRSTNKW